MIKHLMAAVVLCCAFTATGFAQGQGPQGPFTLNALNACATIAIDPKLTSGVYINVSGTWSATLQPQVYVSGQAAVNTQVTPAGSTTYQSTITANGGYNAPAAGPDHFQVCVTAYTSGAASVYLSPTTGVASNTLGGGTGGSGLAGVTTASGTGLSGGCSGTGSTCTLSLLLGCSANQTVQYNGSAWACASVGSGTVTSVAAGAGLTGGPITTSGTLSLSPFQTNGGNNSATGLNIINSTANAVGLTVVCTNTISSTVQCEVGGGSYTGNAATATKMSTSGLINQNWTQTGASTQAWTSVGLNDSTNSPISTTPYTIACDSGSTTLDRATTIRAQSGASVFTVPLSSASGCPGMFTIVMDDGAGTLTFNRTGSDTFTVLDGLTNSDSQTSFTLTNGQYASLNQASSGLWEVRKGVQGSGSLPSGAAKDYVPKTTAAGTTYSAVQEICPDVRAFFATPFTANPENVDLGAAIAAALTASGNADCADASAVVPGSGTLLAATTNPFAGLGASNQVFLKLPTFFTIITSVTWEIPAGSIHILGEPSAGQSVTASNLQLCNTSGGCPVGSQTVPRFTTSDCNGNGGPNCFAAGFAPSAHANYTTGTITCGNNASSCTGSGTAWTSPMVGGVVITGCGTCVMGSMSSYDLARITAVTGTSLTLEGTICGTGTSCAGGITGGNYVIVFPNIAVAICDGCLGNAINNNVFGHVFENFRIDLAGIPSSWAYYSSNAQERVEFKNFPISLDGLSTNATNNAGGCFMMDLSYALKGTSHSEINGPLECSADYNATGNAGTATFTNGSAVISFTNSFVAGQAVQFTTSGTLPTNFSPNTIYWVIATGLSGSQFEVSATYGGSAITAGSAGSGTQKVQINYYGWVFEGLVATTGAVSGGGPTWVNFGTANTGAHAGVAFNDQIEADGVSFMTLKGIHCESAVNDCIEVGKNNPALGVSFQGADGFGVSGAHIEYHAGSSGVVSGICNGSNGNVLIMDDNLASPNIATSSGSGVGQCYGNYIVQSASGFGGPVAIYSNPLKWFGSTSG